MAYINMDRNRGVTLAVVGALHVGVIYALVVGLAGPVWKIIENQPFVGQQIPLPKPPPEVIKAAQPQPNQHAHPQDDHAGTPVVQVKQIFDDTNVIQLPPFGGAVGGEKVDLALPPVPPIPTIAPRGAAPRGVPGTWVTPNDYPAPDLRAGHTGVTGFRLTIGGDGKCKRATW